jgi:N-dimethylarginine dimethylaminohydrolase
VQANHVSSLQWPELLQKVHPRAAEHRQDDKVQPRVLMCEPTHFAISYSINPWMEPAKWAAAAHAVAERQWRGLHKALGSAGALIETVAPREGLPDLVFTANAAVVHDRKALLARFRFPERQGEEPVFAAAFDEFVGRGLFDEARNLFWMGFGQRSEHAAADAVQATFGLEVVPLELVDPRFYHLDTCFCPLPSGAVIYNPAAFTDAARAAIEARVSEDHRVALTDAEAAQFSANAVPIGNTVVMSRCSKRLSGELARRGHNVIATPLDTFLQSGGSAACLTLRLDRCSSTRST